MKVICTLLSCLLLVGCAGQTGNQILADKKAEDLDLLLIKGKTTQEEVKKIFGEPNDSDIMLDGSLKWTYQHVYRSKMVRNFIPIVSAFSSGTDDTTRKLVIIFKDGIVNQFSFSTAQGETTEGVG